MGTVYRATQLSTGKPRALKVMQAAFAQHAGHVERFASEARVGARIQSEHVVDVVAAGVDQTSQRPWLAMELLEGRSLDELIVAVPLAPPPWGEGPCAIVVARRPAPPDLMTGFVGALWPALLISAAAVLVAVLAAGPIVRRIRRLTAQVRRAGEGESSPIEVAGADEIAELGRPSRRAGAASPRGSRSWSGATRR